MRLLDGEFHLSLLLGRGDAFLEFNTSGLFHDLRICLYYAPLR